MKNKIFFFLFLVFIFVRVLYLDRDLPPYDETKFGQKDEQAYNFTSLNLYHFGSISKPIDDSFRIQGSIKFILNNAFTYATLVIFGNNYYGLRAGAVLASLLVFLLFFRLLGLDAMTIPENKKKYIQFIIGSALVLDFGFLVASRNAAPTIFRCFYMMLVLTYIVYLARKPWPRQRLHFLLLGVFCSLLIFFSYLTNAFILAGAFLFIVGRGLAEREIKKTLVAISLLLTGFLIGAIIANWIYVSFNGFGIRDSVSNMYTVYNARVIDLKRSTSGISPVATLLRAGIRKTVSLFSSNLFTLNFTFLFLIVLSCGNTILMMFRRKLRNDVQLLAFAMIVAYALQAFFYNPDSSKWIVLMLPVCLLAVVANVIDKYVNWSRENLPGTGMSSLISLGFVCLAGGLLAFRFLYVGLDPEFQILVFLSFAIMLAVIGIWHYRIAFFKKKVLPILLVLTLAPNAFLSVKYCIVNPEFHYRDACIAMNEIIGDKNMAGVWSDGFRLYTSGNSFFPWYQVQNKERHRKGLTDIFERKLADFTVDFPSGDFFDVERDIDSAGKNFLLQRIANIYLGKGTLGQSIWVYKRIDKNDQDIQGRQP
jgi:hypothetical protein